ncbi:Isochorismatase hydrolase [Mollisia scopiformis]|uniref:Isochorismatase hydrolase n=1 Tax=Mollisia scopiformis TaxID=149040 RepID=A0A194X7Z5_MOLSC|nr:Isochorismatase hydrolase [Mollisia scopiformis]KUJ16288.1 Isochorismatase hydrolase [Mollisia scopiformis]
MASLPNTTGKTAVILIDPYNDFLHPSGKLNGLVSTSMQKTNTLTHIKELVDTARGHKIPIYYGLHQQVGANFIMGWNHATPMQKSQRDNKGFEEGTWGVKIYEGLEPSLENGDVVVSKHWSSSSFQNTDLDYQLRQRDVTNVIIGGLTANTCMESTARYAYELGYHVTMLKDATAGFTVEATEAATELIWPMFAGRVMTVAEWATSLK